jgi:hypothetical protein
MEAPLVSASISRPSRARVATAGDGQGAVAAHGEGQVGAAAPVRDQPGLARLADQVIGPVAQPAGHEGIHIAHPSRGLLNDEYGLGGVLEDHAEPLLGGARGGRGHAEDVEGAGEGHGQQRQHGRAGDPQQAVDGDRAIPMLGGQVQAEHGHRVALAVLHRREAADPVAPAVGQRTLHQRAPVAQRGGQFRADLLVRLAGGGVVLRLLGLGVAEEHHLVALAGQQVGEAAFLVGAADHPQLGPHQLLHGAARRGRGGQLGHRRGIDQCGRGAGPGQQGVARIGLGEVAGGLGQHPAHA